eukprot:CAMPEP_0198199402 /NCGR_PEP_ID=MMETSP1445-20131203/2708_1 /TAXON_ID=36898 /ORGANISM="Pyramimonas sp., Strain CCMP2087" /LENGTH=439 /DNA_ID=CAMNT_0043869241 /DNA_START=82 /DNA_END=1401 /DNA_ORIENTATION=-
MDHKNKVAPEATYQRETHAVQVNEPQYLRQTSKQYLRQASTNLRQASILVQTCGGPKGKIALRAFCAWATYQGIVFILYLPYVDDWELTHKTYGVIDALYFGSVTLSTVGYGDILPRSDHTRLVASFLIVVALSFVVYLIGQLSTVLLDELEEKNRKVLAELADKAMLQDADGDGIPDCQEEGFKGCYESVFLNKRVAQVRLGMSLLLLNLFAGIFVMMVFEDDYEFIEAFYASMVTITTVGYGDFAFTKPGTRLFASVWLLLAPVFTSFSLTHIVEAVFDVEGNKDKARKAALERAMDIGALKAMDKDGDGSLSREEFVSYVVAKLIEAKICEDVGAKFAKKLMQGLASKPEGLGTNGRPSFRCPSKVDVAALLTEPPDLDNPNLEDNPRPFEKNPVWNPERPDSRSQKKHQSLEPLEIGSTPVASTEGYSYKTSSPQ